MSSKKLQSWSIRSIVALALLALFSTRLFAAGHCGAPDEKVRRGIVLIEAGVSVGSGVVIGDNLVLTAAHVVVDRSRVEVSDSGFHTTGFVVSRQRELDLALIETSDNLPFPAVPFARHSRTRLEKVWAMGYPFGQALVAASGQYKGLWANSLYTSASVNFGQSGGGLIACENGRHVLAGIVRAFGATRVDGKLVRRDDVSVATTIDDVRRFLDSRQVALTAHQ
ncbi:MAG TPA: serine protease [Gammaproteobacteria bacterium]|nr:serine protease [Gammaproteobacteria bacterium]